MALSDEVKARTSLRALAEQTLTWDQMKSEPRRGDWWAPCPFHGEATASFHVTEPKGTGGQFYCFGCQAKGSAIDFLMARDGLDFPGAVRALARSGGIDLSADPARAAAVRDAADARRRETESAAADMARTRLARARDLWRSCTAGHPALADYLRGRGIDLDAIGGVPPTLRYHGDLPCYAGEENGQRRLIHRGPAMVAFVGRATLVGVHRTWITGPARARTADGVKVPKQLLGATGAMYGEPVVLTKPASPLVMVGEGIETVLAALGMVMAATGGARPHTEAAVSLSAMAGPGDRHGAPIALSPRTGKPLPSPLPDLAADRPGWLPPAAARRAVILADPSTKCPDTARLMAERAQAKIAARLPEGARLAVPRGHWDHDDDFADLALKGRTP